MRLKTKTEVGTVAMSTTGTRKLAVTLCGSPDAVLRALVDGLPRVELEKFHAAIQEELQRREQARDHH